MTGQTAFAATFYMILLRSGAVFTVDPDGYHFVCNLDAVRFGDNDPDLIAKIVLALADEIRPAVLSVIVH